MVANEEMSQEEQQPGLSPQSNNLDESLNDESDGEEEDDGTNYKFYKIPWTELTKNEEIALSVIYAINISAQSAMTR